MTVRWIGLVSTTAPSRSRWTGATNRSRTGDDRCRGRVEGADPTPFTVRETEFTRSTVVESTLLSALLTFWMLSSDVMPVNKLPSNLPSPPWVETVTVIGSVCTSSPSRLRSIGFTVTVNNSSGAGAVGVTEPPVGGTRIEVAGTETIEQRQEARWAAGIGEVREVVKQIAEHFAIARLGRQMGFDVARRDRQAE